MTVTNSAEQALIDIRAILVSQRRFNATPDSHPAETAAFDQSVMLLEEIARDSDRTQFALSGLAMVVVSLTEPEDVEALLDSFDTTLED